MRLGVPPQRSRVIGNVALSLFLDSDSHEVGEDDIAAKVGGSNVSAMPARSFEALFFFRRHPTTLALILISSIDVELMQGPCAG